MERDRHELLTYTESDFADLSFLMQELSGNIVFTRESLDRMLADPNSHLYVIREEGRIVACACLCIFHQPFSTDATIESVVVSSKMRGKGLGRKLMEHLIEEAARMKVGCIHLNSNPKREAANALYQKMGFERKETNCYEKKLTNFTGNRKNYEHIHYLRDCFGAAPGAGATIFPHCG